MIGFERLRPDTVETYVDLLHGWVTHPRSVFWMMAEADRDAVRTEYAVIAAAAHHDAFLGRVDGEPVFLAETYDPAHSDLAGLPELRTGDLGMHVLVAPPTGPPVPGLTRRVLAAVMRHCLADPAVERVVVDPDVRNTAIAALNAEAGFTVLRAVELPGKTAALSVCPRAAFAASPLSHLQEPS